MDDVALRYAVHDGGWMSRVLEEKEEEERYDQEGQVADMAASLYWQQYHLTRHATKNKHGRPRINLVALSFQLFQ